MAQLIQSDNQLVEQVISACQQEAGRLQKPDPDQIAQLKKRKENLRRSMGILMRQEPQSDVEGQELESALREKRTEMADVEFQLATLTQSENIKIIIPTPQEVKDLIAGLSLSLLDNVETGPPEDIDEIRGLLSRLTGGKIELFQMGENRPYKGWLQGRFKTPLVSVLIEKLTGTVGNSNDYDQEVVVDFRFPDQSEEQIKVFWSLYQQNMMMKEIAEILGCSRSNVSRLLKRAAIYFQQPVEDGRKRRSKLIDKQQETPMYKKIAKEASELWENWKSYREIGRLFKTTDTTVEKAIRYWYESQGLPVLTPVIQKKRNS